MPKSPIYGRGRNRKRRKGPFHATAANISMKGKKSKPDLCWCCVCIDFRDNVRRKEHEKEISNYMKGVEH